MLVLTLNPDNAVELALVDGRTVRILMVSAKANRQRIGIEAPKEVRIDRVEATERDREIRRRG